ncbi:MAG: pilus (MSHA type) biogenesis protein MshL [Burkholderiales bacterium]
MNKSRKATKMEPNSLIKLPFCVVCSVLLCSACAVTPLKPDRHIQAEAPRPVSIPETVRSVPLPPPPKAEARPEKYSVVVNNVPVQQLLFALARDAKVNVDIHNGIEGQVTLNAIDQTLAQILTRISKQVDMRFEMDGATLVVMPDSPYLKNYIVDYANISRNSRSSVGIATQVATTGAGSDSTASSAGTGVQGNNSTTSVSNISNNQFWATLVQNIKDLLRETDKIFPEGSTETQFSQSGNQLASANAPASVTQKSGKKSTTTALPKGGDFAGEQQGGLTARTFSFREAASVIANPESGLISVRASGRQHEKIQEFLDQIMGAAKRQVLIEATIVEVLLNDNYQGGVDWSRIAQGGSGVSLSQTVTGGNLSTAPVFVLGYANPTSRFGNISGAVKLLSSFGDTRVLSSPKIMALNNQTAILKVVDEKVYFTVERKVTEATINTGRTTEFTSTIHTVPVGVVMSVTPQISDGNSVSLNIRPTVSRITSFAVDPTPRLQGANFDNLIPEVQTRELESLLRVDSGQIVVMGGLMEDRLDRKRDGLPLAKDIPIVGDAFSYRNDTSKKTELVIFLRPIVIKDGSFDGDFKNYRELLPDNKFFSGSNTSGNKP